MRFHRLTPLAAALLVAGVGLVSIASTSQAQSEDSKDKVEKRAYRFTPGQDEDRPFGAGYLGVQVQGLTSSLRRAKSIPGSVEGALVNTIEDGSPADNAGIKKGDVILEVDHKPTSDPSELIDVVRALDPESKVPVLLWREGSRKTVTVTVGSRPDDFQFEVPAPPTMPRMRGPRGSRDGTMRMEVLRPNNDDIARQLREIQDQLSRLREDDLARLERQIRDLRAELKGRAPVNDERDQSEDGGSDDGEDQ